MKSISVSSKRSRTAIDKISEALDLYFDQFLPLSGSEIDQNQHSELLKLSKMQFLKVKDDRI